MELRQDKGEHNHLGGYAAQGHYKSEIIQVDLGTQTLHENDPSIIGTYSSPIDGFQQTRQDRPRGLSM